MTVNGISISPFPSISVRFIFIVIVVLFYYFRLHSIRLLLLSIHCCTTTYLLVLYFISFSSSSIFTTIQVLYYLGIYQYFTVQPSSNIFRISIFSPSSLLPICFGYQYFYRLAFFQNFILILKY